MPLAIKANVAPFLPSELCRSFRTLLKMIAESKE
jgi:hypothetical protein